MSSRTPEELRERYGGETAEWLRANMMLFQRPWKRRVMEDLIREKEGVPEPLRLARSNNRAAWIGVGLALLALIVGVLAIWLG